jgi:hypothetical protein
VKTVVGGAVVGAAAVALLALLRSGSFDADDLARGAVLGAIFTSLVYLRKGAGTGDRIGPEG